MRLTQRSTPTLASILVFSLAAIASAAPLAAQQINTGSSDRYVIAFGAANTATYGQTFTVPVGLSQLNQFTFQLFAYSNGSALDFYGFLMGWSGDRATGSVLYQSALQHGTDNGTFSSPMTYTFNTGGINLSSGSVYVAFLNASEFIAANPLTTALDNMPTGANGYADSYSGGDFVWENNGGNFGMLTTSPWDNPGEGFDAAFTATFSETTATPEPASLALLATGLFGLVPMMRRKSRK